MAPRAPVFFLQQITGRPGGAAPFPHHHKNTHCSEKSNTARRCRGAGLGGRAPAFAFSAGEEGRALGTGRGFIGSAAPWLEMLGRGTIWGVRERFRSLSRQPEPAAGGCGRLFPPPPIHTPGAKRLRGSHEGFVEGSASICSPPGIECKETKVIEKRRRKKKKKKRVSGFLRGCRVPFQASVGRAAIL